jgi:hypothetical protein
MIRSLSRVELEELAYTLIRELDELEADSDDELSGDEYDGSDSEDDVAYFFGPRCPRDRAVRLAIPTNHDYKQE